MHEIARYVKVNCVGTAALLEAAGESRASLHGIVLASSRAVYGEGRYVCPACGIVLPQTRSRLPAEGGWDPCCPNCSGKIRPLAASEDQLPQPVSCYGVTKLFQEQLMAQFCAAFGLSGTALRFQNVYGPDQSLSNPYTGILSIFSTRALSGKDLSIYEDGEMLRNFVYADDAVEAIRLALDRQAPGFEVFNVGSGTPVTVLGTAHQLLHALGLEHRVALRITGQWRSGDVRHAWADIANIRRRLGFEPKVPLGEGLHRLAQWVKTQPLPADIFSKMEDELARKGVLSVSVDDGLSH